MLVEYLCNGTHSCFLLSNILWTIKDPVKIGSSHYCSRGIITLIVEYTAVFSHPAITLSFFYFKVKNKSVLPEGTSNYKFRLKVGSGQKFAGTPDLRYQFCRFQN